MRPLLLHEFPGVKAVAAEACVADVRKRGFGVDAGRAVGILTDH